MKRFVCALLSIFFMWAFSFPVDGFIPSRGLRLKFAMEKLANAQKRENLEDVYIAVDQINHLLGDLRGTPETPEEYRRMSTDLPLFPIKDLIR